VSHRAPTHRRRTAAERGRTRGGGRRRRMVTFLIFLFRSLVWSDAESRAPSFLAPPAVATPTAAGMPARARCGLRLRHSPPP
jgi:hypothetical protein